MVVKVFVNDREVNLPAGMTVRHALMAAGVMEEIRQGKKVYDDQGHEVGLGGALTEGAKLYVR